MFKAALKNHTSPPSVPKVTTQQKSLFNSFKHGSSAETTGPLSIGSGNVAKSSGNIYGTKRTSSGLAKAIGSQEDFDYPALNISDSGTDMSRGFNSAGSMAGRTPVFFDENDFDSDLDLDVEDPAIRDTISYPALPTIKNDSVHGSMGRDTKPALDSSQPVSWPSSPVQQVKPAPAPKPKPTKRRTLPWLAEQTQTQSSSHDYLQADSERPQKRRTTQATQIGDSTPAPKASAKAAYPWNTTASAVKEQQKSLREANKKANKGTEEEIAKAKSDKKKNTVASIFLSDEQKQVLRLVTEQKKSVFFTGSAGTGKSVLLREIIAALRRKYIREPDRIAVTASTGLAACNIGGITLHSFAGIGLGKESAEDLVKKIRKNATARQRWLRTKVLVIDEISMVDGELFDKLSQIGRTIRNNGRAFGGIQLVITGDYFQLPPVPERGRAAKFAFDAATWSDTIDHTIGLHHVFRQKDPVFAAMLNEMREGHMKPETISRFKSLNRALEKHEENIEATELFPTRAEVDRANNVRMANLHGTVFPYEARDGGAITDRNIRDKMLDNCMAPKLLTLKKGAQVMLIKNMDETLVNGSLGKITGFMTEKMFELYKEDEEAFLDGRGGPSETEALAQQKAAVFGLDTQQVYPVVRFSIADGTTRDLLCKREVWKIELPNGEVQASREQIPLILAWALSIHKAQGQTLERVRVDLAKVFEKGQAYVALSRATNMAGLQVLNFDPRKVMAHEKVRAFYAGLSRVEIAEEEARKGNALAGMMKKRAATDYEQDFVGR